MISGSSVANTVTTEAFTIPKIVFATLSATFGVYCLAAGVQNCLFIQTNFYERILLLKTSFLLIKPGVMTDLVGLALFGAVYLFQKMREKRKREETAASSLRRE